MAIWIRHTPVPEARTIIPITARLLHLSRGPASVGRAIIRFHYYLDPDFSNPASDTIAFWDEVDTSGTITTAFNMGGRVMAAVNAAARVHEQWVRVDLDLVSGTARAFEIDNV